MRPLFIWVFGLAGSGFLGLLLNSRHVARAKSQDLSEASRCSPACGFGWHAGDRRVICAKIHAFGAPRRRPSESGLRVLRGRRSLPCWISRPIATAFQDSKSESEGFAMKTIAPRWTLAEDEIVRSTGGPSEAAKRLPGRTYEAAKSRWRALGMKAFTHWTKREDAKLAKYQHEPLAKQAKRFKSRTCAAIETRRRTLGLANVARPAWLGSEIKQLKLLYPTATRAEVLAAFPRHSFKGVAAMANSLGLIRPIKLQVPLQSPLCQQVRRRAQQDGIALCKLGTQTNCGCYFSSPPKRENYNKIARAVEFFGGRLVIDWQDE
jgi:hypothetical protein